MKQIKRKITGVAGVVAIALMLSGCATTSPTSGIGPAGFFVSVVEPVDVGTGKAGSGLKMGTATCTNLFGFAVIGDCSINAAARNGGITEIAYVDKEVTRILSIFGKVTVRVYGR